MNMLFIMALIMPAFGFIKTGEKSIGSVVKNLQEAKHEGLGLSQHELRVKQELQSLKQKNPSSFHEKVFDEEASNPAEYQSFLYEVLAGKSDVEKAKILAQLEILKAVQKDWNILKTTVLNESSHEDFGSFKPRLLSRLSTIIFSPVKRSDSIDTKNYRFKIEDWAYVVVSKDLKKINWKITISAANDRNKLEPGADKIRILGKDEPNSLHIEGDSGSDAGYESYDNGGGPSDDESVPESDDSELLY